MCTNLIITIVVAKVSRQLKVSLMYISIPFHDIACVDQVQIH